MGTSVKISFIGEWITCTDVWDNLLKQFHDFKIIKKMKPSKQKQKNA